MPFKTCPICGHIFDSLGFASHRAGHRRQYVKKTAEIEKLLHDIEASNIGKNTRHREWNRLNLPGSPDDPKPEMVRILKAEIESR